MTFDVIITADRSMMSNYHGKEFLGFGTTGPIFVKLPFGLSEKFHLYLFAPKLKTDKLGRPTQAPYGLRKVEAKLLDAGINAAVVDPDHVPRHLRSAKVLMIGHHDFFGLNPPSSTWAVILGKEPMNAMLFKRFMNSIEPYVREAKKRGLKVIVGGPSAWQWLYFPDLAEKWHIDTIFDGEFESIGVDLVKAALEGRELPKYIYVGAREAPTVDDISTIKAPSINGLVEIGRGCPRGCAFCSVTLRPTRWYPLEKIEKELEVNARHGVVHGILHSDEVPLYGSSTVVPNPKALIKLHLLAKRYYKTLSWSHSTLVAVLYGEKRQGKLFTKLADIIIDEYQEWWGAQIGLETGSVALASKVMPGKAAPIGIEKWHEIVEEAMAIMHEIRLIPAITIIVGTPGETPKDVVETTELIERLRPYRSLIVPLFYVPMSHVRSEKTGWLDKPNLYPEHIELLRVVARHSIYWARDIVNRFYLRGAVYWPLRFALNYFINYIDGKVRELEKHLEAYIEELRRSREEKRREVLAW